MLSANINIGFVIIVKRMGTCISISICVGRISYIELLFFIGFIFIRLWGLDRRLGPCNIFIKTISHVEVDYLFKQNLRSRERKEREILLYIQVN